MAEKTRYSDAELEEFRAIILEKLELAQRDYELLKARKNVHTQSKCGNPIDRNTLMNGENVSMKPCNRLQDNRQKPRFIVHLDNKGDRLSPCLFMKWKNIIFVFVERASADSCALCCILYSVHFAGVQKLLCLHHLQQDFRNRTFPHYKIFLFPPRIVKIIRP